jgi:hypothetical protein
MSKFISGAEQKAVEACGDECFSIEPIARSHAIIGIGQEIWR